MLTVQEERKDELAVNSHYCIFNIYWPAPQMCAVNFKMWYLNLWRKTEGVDIFMQTTRLFLVIEKCSQKHFFAKILYLLHSPQCVFVPPAPFKEGRSLLFWNNDHFHSLNWWINWCDTWAEQFGHWAWLFILPSTELPLRIRWITVEQNVIQLLVFFKASLPKEGAFHKDNLWCPKVWDFPSSKICLTEREIDLIK